MPHFYLPPSRARPGQPRCRRVNPVWSDLKVAHFLLSLACGYFCPWQLLEFRVLAPFLPCLLPWLSKTTTVQQNEESFTKNKKEREREKKTGNLNNWAHWTYCWIKFTRLVRLLKQEKTTYFNLEWMRQNAFFPLFSIMAHKFDLWLAGKFPKPCG